jgi:hypothetical protein
MEPWPSEADLQRWLNRVSWLEFAAKVYIICALAWFVGLVIAYIWK